MESTAPSTDSGPTRGASCPCFMSTTPTWYPQSPGRSSWRQKALIVSGGHLMMASLSPSLWKSATNTTSKRAGSMASIPTLPPMASRLAHLTRTGKPSRHSAMQTICCSFPVWARGMWTQLFGHGTTTTPETGWTGVTTRHPCRQLCQCGRKLSPSPPLTNGMKAHRLRGLYPRKQQRAYTLTTNPTDLTTTWSLHASGLRILTRRRTNGWCEEQKRLKDNPFISSTCLFFLSSEHFLTDFP